MPEQITRIPKKALCWDLDETLGSFRRIAYEMGGEEAPDWEHPIALRYGLEDLLHEFSEDAGYIHFITTSGTFDYANEALKRTGIADRFKQVFGRDTVARGWGKHYRPVAETIGFSDDDMRAGMIAIGDAPGDKPMDVDIVFLHVGLGNSMDALVIREIITTVLDKGEGHFRQGFEKLYAEAVPEFPDEEPQFQNRTFDTGGGIKFQLEYRPLGQFSNIGKPVVPVITGIQAPDYIREMPEV